MEALSEKFLYYIAGKNKISMKDAIKKVDYCFKNVSLEMGIETSKVIKAFYQYLNPGYNKYCALLDPEECVNSLYCTPFENECIPIYVKDYDIINKDPDSYIEKMGIEELKKLRDVAAHLYYNVGDSGIEDNSFDAIEWHLRKRLKKAYDKDIKLGAIPISKLRIDLPYPMASLNKLYPEDRSFHLFIKNTPVKGLIWSDKLDGVSCI